MKAEQGARNAETWGGLLIAQVLRFAFDVRPSFHGFVDFEI